MANRAMNAKLQRARKQAREAAQLEFTKPAYILQIPKHDLRNLHRHLKDGVPGVTSHQNQRQIGSKRLPREGGYEVE